jgi:hypothetical protein
MEHTETADSERADQQEHGEVPVVRDDKPGFYDDDGNLVATGAEATAAFNAHLDQVQAHNRQVLAQLKPHELARLEAWLRSRTRATPPVRPPSRATSGSGSGRAPREARNGRRRGSRRGERATSSSSDDPDDPEPPERRLCENTRCERDISHRPALARYCDDACQQEAYRDRRTIELLDEMSGTIAKGLSCICEPQHNLIEHDHCLKCSYPRGVVTRGWVTDPAPSTRSFVVTPARAESWRLRPDRELAAKLRRTRTDRKAAA